MVEILKQIGIFLISMPIEVLFIVMGICYAKNIKEKRVLFYILLLICSVLSMLIIKWQTWYYLAFIASSYLSMRALYKSHISDLFIFMII